MKLRHSLLWLSALALSLVIAGGICMSLSSPPLKLSMQKSLASLHDVAPSVVAPDEEQTSSAASAAVLKQAAPSYSTYRGTVWSQTYPRSAMATVRNNTSANGQPRSSLPTDRTVEATVTVDGKPEVFLPNQLGDFPRIGIEAKQTVPISVALDGGGPGDPVVVQVQDGGGLAKGAMVQTTTLDSNNIVSFNFTAGTQEGIYRVTLTTANDQKTLNFWVNPSNG